MIFEIVQLVGIVLFAVGLLVVGYWCLDQISRPEFSGKEGLD